MTTFTPGDRFRFPGGDVAHVVDSDPRWIDRRYLHAPCGVVEVTIFASPSDDRPLCKECARAMEGNNR